LRDAERRRAQEAQLHGFAALVLSCIIPSRTRTHVNVQPRRWVRLHFVTRLIKVLLKFEHKLDVIFSLMSF
jgi:hypothetical protein